MNLNRILKSSLLRIVAKSLLLFIFVNCLFIFLIEVPIGKITLYNSIFPGRYRLPFGEQPEQSYNLTLDNLDAMIASHEINNHTESSDVYRVILLGDSSVWGFLQEDESTLAGILNTSIDFRCNHREIRVYNLGYPSLSVLKDLMILEKIQQYQPDLIIWFVTLESLPAQEQLITPLVANNPVLVNQVIENYDLDFDKFKINLLDYTIVGRRRELADMIRLQLYGIPWAATGIDQAIPIEYTPAQRDFEEDSSFKSFKFGALRRSDLALNVLGQAAKKLNETDFIFINEPVLVSNGVNSDIRYNFYYPRWAYDAYRRIIREFMTEKGLEYYDLWDIIPESDFTNSAIHLTTEGEWMLAERTSTILQNHCQK